MPDPIISDQTQDPTLPTFPEMTDFPTIPAVPQDIGTTPQAPGPTDIPPIITNSKTPKKRGGKLIATILGIFLLVGAVGAGVVLVGQKQLFKQKADNSYICRMCMQDCLERLSGPGEDQSRCDGLCDTQCNSGGSESGGPAKVSDVPLANNPCTEGYINTTGACCLNGQMERIYRRTDCTTYNDCTGPACTAPTTTCTSGDKKSCTTTQSCPGEFVCEYNGKWSTTCYDIADNCPPQTQSAEIPASTSCSLTGNRICVGNDVTGDCYQGGQGGQYACYKLTGDYGKVISTCANGDSICSCTCPSPYTWKAHENGHWWCFDTAAGTCDGQYPYAERCSLLPQQCTGGTTTATTEDVQTPTPPPGSTPTPPPTPGSNAACYAVKAYDTSWNLLTNAQLSALSARDIVRFTVSGTPANQIDKARFTINGVLEPEVITKKPGTDEYYTEYTIPPVVVSFTVTAQVHHLTLGWF